MRPLESSVLLERFPEHRMESLLASAVVFDLDGVLIDSERTNVSSARDALQAEGLRLADEEIPLVVGRHPVDYLPELVRRRGLDESLVLDLMTRQHARYDELSAEEALTPGARECLEGLSRRGLRLALATSSDRRRVEERLAHHDVLELFEFLLTREDVTRRKPDPEVYERAIESLAIAPESIVVVEDSQHGIAAAKAAGLRCIALRTAWVSDAARAPADRVVERLEEITGFVRLH